MTDVVHAAPAVVVVRRLDVVAAHVGGFVADLQYAGSQLGVRNGRVRVVVACVSFGGGAAQLDLVQAAVVHVIGEFGVVVDGVIVGFDAVGARRKVSEPNSICLSRVYILVDRKFGVVSCLDGPGELVKRQLIRHCADTYSSIMPLIMPSELKLSG